MMRHELDYRAPHYGRAGLYARADSGHRDGNRPVALHSARADCGMAGWIAGALWAYVMSQLMPPEKLPATLPQPTPQSEPTETSEPDSEEDSAAA